MSAVECATIRNWSGNVEFMPRVCYRPRDEAEVLAILNKHRDGHIRVVGSKHSMNEIAKSDDVSIEMSAFQEVSDLKRGAETVKVGAGVTLAALQEKLARVGRTLPARGTIKKQTIAGAISTGTHGSGKPSLSNFVTGVRIAAYDPSGQEAKIFDFDLNSGEELLAARTALGAMGVILEVTLSVSRGYFVEQSAESAKSIDDVLSTDAQSGRLAYPMQLFIRFPYHDQGGYYVSRRRESQRGPEGAWERLKRRLRRLQNRVLNDWVLPLLIKYVVARLASGLVQGFYKSVLPCLLMKQGTVIDDDDHVQTMRHEWFRNQDIELFVPENRLREADEWLKKIIIAFAKPSEPPPQDILDAVARAGLTDAFAHRNYTHHAPIFYQRVMPDDTLISMTADTAEPYYSIIVLSYLPPGPGSGFEEFAKFVGEGLVRLFDARGHWGKHFPLSSNDLEPRYGRNLARFRQICNKYDPKGVFRNEFTARALGLP